MIKTEVVRDKILCPDSLFPLSPVNNLERLRISIIYICTIFSDLILWGFTSSFEDETNFKKISLFFILSISYFLPGFIIGFLLSMTIHWVGVFIFGFKSHKYINYAPLKINDYYSNINDESHNTTNYCI